MTLSLLLLALANATPPPGAATPAATPIAVSAMPSIEASSRRDRSLARLEAIRSAAGAGALARSEPLAQAATQHAGYLTANGLRSTPSIHAEAAGLAGFTGADPFIRMRAAGYRSSYATEVVGDAGQAAADTDCVDRLMNTVYHAALLLSRVTQAGLAYGDGPAASACVIDLGVPLEPPGTPVPVSADIVRYPWPGMTLPTGTFRPGSENPRPSTALLPGATAGIPVLVGLRTADALAAATEPAGIEIQAFELRDDRGIAVPSVLLADPAIAGPAVVADKALHGLFAVLVPRQPLAPGRYRVILHATLGQHVVAPASWEFSIDRR